MLLKDVATLRKAYVFKKRNYDADIRIKIQRKKLSESSVR